MLCSTLSPYSRLRCFKWHAACFHLVSVAVPSESCRWSRCPAAGPKCVRPLQLSWSRANAPFRCPRNHSEVQWLGRSIWSFPDLTRPDRANPPRARGAGEMWPTVPMWQASLLDAQLYVTLPFIPVWRAANWLTSLHARCKSIYEGRERGNLYNSEKMLLEAGISGGHMQMMTRWPMLKWP